MTPIAEEGWLMRILRHVAAIDNGTSNAALDLSALTDGRPSSVLVTNVVLAASPNFEPGPLPVMLPSNETTRDRRGKTVADRGARESLVGLQQARVLYGDPVVGTRRMHRMRTDTWPPETLGIELLIRASNPSGRTRGLLAIHVCAWESGREARDEHADLLRRYGRTDRRVWQDIRSVIAPTLDFEGEPVRRVSFVDDSDRPDEALLDAYLFVSGASADRREDLRARAERHEFTVTRTDWSALVLRDGATLVSHQSSEEPFTPTLRALTHSIHLDSLFLALLQRELLDESGERAVTASLQEPRELAELEVQHFEFKRQYWRTSLTDRRTSPSDDIFRTFQNELLTPRDVTDVEDRVQEGARVARTLRSEQSAAAQERLNSLVRNVSIVVGSFTLAFTAAPVAANPSWRLFATAVGLGLVAVSVAYLALGQIRRIRRR